GDPVPGLFTTPDVAFVVNALATAAGVAVVLPARYNAAAPHVCGVAIDVPLIVFVAVVDEYHDEVMCTPGAKMSTHVPVLAHTGFVSVLSVALTVIAAAARAGDVVQASTALPAASPLPAATQKTTPALTAPVTASSRACDAPPPRDMLATAGLMAFCATQFTPAITPAFVPEPEQLRTRTAMSETPFATPYVEPPTVPATCVPCPAQSMPFWPSPTSSTPTDARPPNCVCEIRMPVSTM